jgi:hypothetical protein
MNVRFVLSILVYTLVLLFPLFNPVHAASLLDYDQIWLRSFNSAEINHGRSGGVAADSNGNVYMTATADVSNTMITNKYNSSGDLVWSRTIANSTGLAITVDQFDNVLAVGTTSGNFLLAKYTKDGELVWAKNYDHFGYYGSANDYATAIALDASGNIYLAGYGGYPTSEVFNEYVIVKVDPYGNQVWGMSYDNGNNSVAGGVAVDLNGDIYITGQIITPNGNFDLYTVKFDSSRNLLWERTYNSGGNDYTGRAVIDSDGNFYISGSSDTSGVSLATVIKYSPTGEVLWNRSFPGTYSALDIKIDKNSLLYVTGTTNAPTEANDQFVAIIAADGTDVGYQTFPSVNGGRGIAVDREANNIYLAGDTWKYYHSYGYDYLTTRLEKKNPYYITSPGLFPAGYIGATYQQTLTAKGGAAPYTWSVIGGTLPSGLTLNQQTGQISGTPDQSGKYSITFQASDMNTVNASKDVTIHVLQPLVVSTNDITAGIVGIAYNQPLLAQGGQSPYKWGIISGRLPAGLAINVDTGTISGTPAESGTFDFTVGITGELGSSTSKSFTLLVNDWRFTTKPGAGLSSGQGVVPDEAGNFYVIGYYYTTTENSQADMIIIKYDPSGAIVWQRTYDSGGNDLGYGIALDSAGNPIITGVAGDRCFTRKYDSTGNVAWTVLSNLAVSEVCRSVKVDSADNVYVAGNVTGSDGNSDYLVIKYSSGGDVVWSTTYNDSTADFARSIAMDNSGNLYVAGVSNNNSLTLKYDQSGTLVWAHPYNNLHDVRKIAVDADDKYYLLTPTDLMIFKNDGSFYYGNGGTGQQNGDIAVDGSMSKYQVGSSLGNFLAFRQNKHGDSVWNKSYDGGYTEKANAIAIGRNGAVYVTGESVNGNSGSIVTLRLDSPIITTPTSLPVGEAGTAYSTFLQAGGGAPGPYSWSLMINGGSLPPGFTLNSSTGEISGLLDNGATYTFLVKAVSPNGIADEKWLTLKIAASPSRPLAVLPLSIPEGLSGTSYSQSFSATGGTIPYSWSFLGAVPPGMTWYPGMLYGIPQTGYYTFTVRVTDGAGEYVDTSYQFPVFNRYPYGKIQREDGLYPSIYDAYQGTLDNDVLQLQATLYKWGVILDRSVKITLQGGYDNSFTASSGYTTIVGSLTIATGSVTVDRIIVQ